MTKAPFDVFFTFDISLNIVSYDSDSDTMNWFSRSVRNQIKLHEEVGKKMEDRGYLYGWYEILETDFNFLTPAKESIQDKKVKVKVGAYKDEQFMYSKKELEKMVS